MMKSGMHCLVLILVSFSFLNPLKTSAANIETYGPAWIDKSGPYPVIHVSGSDFEMGRQYGYLAGDLTKANIDNIENIVKKQQPDLMKKLPEKVFYSLRKLVGFCFWLTFPKDIKYTLEGVVAGAKERHIKINKFDLAFLNSVIDLVGIADAISEKIKRLTGKTDGVAEVSVRQLFKVLSVPEIHNQCDSMAVWGSRTVGGKTFQSRNTDLEAGDGLQKFPIVTVYKKDGKIPVFNGGFAGMMGVFAGMNAYGVGVGQVWAFSLDIAMKEPWQLRMRDAFMESKTAEEAGKYFASHGGTPYGCNFIFADSGEFSSGQNVGWAVETSAKHVVMFHGNDPGELVANYKGKTWGLPIPDGIARADVTNDPLMRSRSTSANGPDGDPSTTLSYGNRYRGQIEPILAYEQKRILMGEPEAEQISKDTAMHSGNLLNMVYANTDKEAWFTVSKVLDDGTVVNAYERPYVYIPFKRYLVKTVATANSVTLSKWAKQAPSEFDVNVSKKGTKSSFHLSLGAADEVTYTDVSLQKGSLVEVVDSATGDLVDRVFVQ